MTIRHIVAWKLAASDDATRSVDAQRVISALRGLTGVVPAIESLTVGTGVVAGNWDLALVVDVADLAALDAYQNHPAHQAVLPLVRSVVSERMAVDIDLSAPAR
ncbi:hypothetical protein FHX49_002272 [Microbacterium endophyticum]|uniref:Stress-response A/B barrel domain-containing protein n=1 Tax=Microbacterium endophyticum TaxID=1526412 RepID=A0A7W4V330_9MICO|nr:Dabb family protein [Microbacterium endophyticum]MBB2975977.1 hypothetical protein [Microbacterium endophyticum]MBB2976693.1 hypothetical protein [Microbacterium endophyticum]NIK37654.1 hypothetical protein [Microbacterium endophyticum]